MTGSAKGPAGPGPDAWDALHQGIDREGVDSPARFKLNRAAVLTAVRGLPGVQREAAPPMQPAARPTVTTIRQRTMMRPYAHTRGRTRPNYELELEALVSTSDRGRRYEGAASVQHRRICDLCVDARSIAEIAAYLHLPLNVVKVLVSDMDDLELVVIHQPGLAFGDRSSREFMARVLEGLRAL